MTNKAKIEVIIASIILLVLIVGGIMLWINVFSGKKPVPSNPVTDGLYTGEVPYTGEVTTGNTNNTNAVSNINRNVTIMNSNNNQPDNNAAITELKIEDTAVGTGREVKSGDTVTIHYKGTLLNGTKFDSSYDRGNPFTTQIGVGRVIKGWDLGVVGMKVGGKRKLTIPSDMAYGPQGQGIIPPNSPLVFELELVDVR